MHVGERLQHLRRSHSENTKTVLSCFIQATSGEGLVCYDELQEQQKSTESLAPGAKARARLELTGKLCQVIKHRPAR